MAGIMVEETGVRGENHHFHKNDNSTRASTDRDILVVMNYSQVILEHFDWYRRNDSQPIKSQRQLFILKKGISLQIRLIWRRVTSGK
jgi:hypothetical protein